MTSQDDCLEILNKCEGYIQDYIDSINPDNPTIRDEINVDYNEQIMNLKNDYFIDINTSIITPEIILAQIKDYIEKNSPGYVATIAPINSPPTTPLTPHELSLMLLRDEIREKMTE